MMFDLRKDLEVFIGDFKISMAATNCFLWPGVLMLDSVATDMNSSVLWTADIF